MKTIKKKVLIGMVVGLAIILMITSISKVFNPKVVNLTSNKEVITLKNPQVPQITDIEMGNKNQINGKEQLRNSVSEKILNIPHPAIDNHQKNQFHLKEIENLIHSEEKRKFVQMQSSPRTLDLSIEAQTILETLKDTTIPIENRKNEILALVQKNDEISLQTLQIIGDAKIYLNWMAIESIGSIQDPSLMLTAEEYLKAKLASSGGENGDDLSVTCAAIRGYSRLMGHLAVRELSQCLQRNRTRSDGHHELVCTEIVEALAMCVSINASIALLAELDRSSEPAWSLEYGSKVVQALQRTELPSGSQSLTAYADRLEAVKHSNPAVRVYFERKIAEARKVASSQQ